MLNEYDISALLVTIKLASVTTAILILIGTPIAWWLSQTRFKFKAVIEAIIALPLILPPTVLGFYLLMTLGTNGLTRKSPRIIRWQVQLLSHLRVLL